MEDVDAWALIDGWHAGWWDGGHGWMAFWMVGWIAGVMAVCLADGIGGVNGCLDGGWMDG